MKGLEAGGTAASRGARSALGLVAALAILAGCVTPPKPELPPAAPPAAPVPTPPVPSPVPPPVPPAPPPVVPNLQPVGWEDLPGWPGEDPGAALEPLLRSCGVLKAQPAWEGPCREAAGLDARDRDALRRFLERRFVPHRAVNPDGSGEGLVTGYYEPVLKGSLKPGKAYRHPVYGVPDDLLVVDLAEVYPELKHLRLRGRLDGRKVVPYYTREQIDQGRAPVKGKEILWVDDPVELFFLQVQGSGQVKLDNGSTVRIGYADQNGHTYRSIGRILVERNELPLDKASMQGIKDWGRANPQKLPALLNENPSFVFFRELPAGLPGPLGSLGVPVTGGRSLAIDPRYIPQGSPVFLATTWPNSDRPLTRLMVAQDTGGAIKGPVRADFYWGSGPEAGQFAGRMRQQGRMWVLLPKNGG